MKKKAKEARQKRERFFRTFARLKRGDTTNLQTIDRFMADYLDSSEEFMAQVRRLQRGLGLNRRRKLLRGVGMKAAFLDPDDLAGDAAPSAWNRKMTIAAFRAANQGSAHPKNGNGQKNPAASSGKPTKEARRGKSVACAEPQCDPAQLVTGVISVKTSDGVRQALLLPNAARVTLNLKARRADVRWD